MKQMSGIPRPVTDLPDRAISVRLIRGDLSNNIAGHPVDLQVGSKKLTVKTDDQGRAEFKDLPPGATAKASATVDGEALESQEFPVPEKGGVRLMLVATDKTKGPATTPDAPPIDGTVVIGSESRIVIEPIDEAVNVFYLLDISNSARAPVKLAQSFVFDMPRECAGTSVMQGSSPQASVNGRRVAVQGPFAPGHTFAQIACELPALTGDVHIEQTFPANLEALSVVVKKVGQAKLTSPQIGAQRDMQAENDVYIAGSGGAIAARQPIQITVTGLPAHSTAPRWISLGLVGFIVIVGIWASSGGDDPAEAADERKRLIAKREKLLADLVKLERDRKNNRVDDRRYASRRTELLEALEPVYSALDTADVALPGRAASAPTGAA